jgi:hypothetical protein
LSWVFRAANFEDYYLCRIAAAPGGGYELARCAVLGGTAEAAAFTPVRLASNAKPTVTVRLRASEDEFTVFVDGEPAAHWNDGRLSTGGVGFLGTGEDRARLYWVRLSFTGAPVRSM